MCVCSPTLKPEDDGTKVGLMNISVLEEDGSFLDVVRRTLAADAQPVRHCHLTHHVPPWQEAVHSISLTIACHGETASGSLGWT